MKQLAVFLAVAALIFAATGIASGESLMWGTGSPDWGSGASGPSPVIFQFDTSTGVISTTFSFETESWMWTSGVADSGKYLYAIHNTYDTVDGYSDTHDFKVAKIDRTTGAVLSDTSISGFLAQTYSQVNALDFVNGKLYAVENASSGSSLRGYALEIVLDSSGDVSGATSGAYVGPDPDAGLDYHDGMWYATSWGYTPAHKQGSLVFTSPDIMNTAFTQVGTGDNAVTGIGMIDGWEYDEAGELLAVSWYNADYSATSVYSINTDNANWTATSKYDLASQLPTSITQLNGLSDVVPEPTTVAGLVGLLATGGGLWLRRRRRGARRAPWSEESRQAIRQIVDHGRTGA